MAKKKPKPIKRTFVQIKDETWHCFLWRDKDYSEVHGADSEAITYTTEKEIHLNRSDFSLQTVCHELVHAYWVNLHLEDTVSMEIGKIEEIVASLIGANIIGLYQDSIHVYNELKGDLAGEEI